MGFIAGKYLTDDQAGWGEGDGAVIWTSATNVSSRLSLLAVICKSRMQQL